MAKSKRIASIDWMRGFVMILMLLDHVSMAYNAQHDSSDSAALYVSGTPLPAFEFFTRWISHLCAPVFVFLAGTALAISIERKLARGFDSSKIDRDILLRGAFIAILDPTIISLFSGRMTIQVLYAIGVAMMCMAFFRRFSSTSLIIMALAWIGSVNYSLHSSGHHKPTASNRSSLPCCFRPMLRLTWSSSIRCSHGWR